MQNRKILFLRSRTFLSNHELFFLEGIILSTFIEWLSQNPFIPGLGYQKHGYKGKFLISRFANSTNAGWPVGFPILLTNYQLFTVEYLLILKSHWQSEVKLCVAAEKGDDCGEGNARQVNHGL